MTSKLKTFLIFTSMMRVELFMLLMMFVYCLKRTPLDMLIQDKLCRFKYNMSENFCYNLYSIEEMDENYSYKSLILSDAVKYNMYSTLITFLPGIVWSLFLGAWTDRYSKGRKYILLVAAFTQSIENLINAFNSYFFEMNINWILFSFVPYILSGSMPFGICYTYLVATTPHSYKTLRMTIIDILVAIAAPLATFTAGIFINKSPVGGNGQLHNYFPLFLLASLLTFIAFIWALFLMDEEKDRTRFVERLGDHDEIMAQRERRKSSTEMEVHPLRLLFDLKNVNQIIKAFVKKRPNYVRAQIFLVTAAMFCNLFILLSPNSFLFQFVEKIYDWDAKTYNYVTSYGQIVNSCVIIVVSPVLIKVLKLNDMILSIIGFVGIFCQMLIRAVILTPLGFYLSIAMSCTMSLGAVGFKTHLSKIVDSSELGKVFTLLMVIDGTAPIIASTIFAQIFKMTIDSVPSACFLILSLMSLIPIIIAIIIDLINLKINDKTTEMNDKNEAIITKM